MSNQLTPEEILAMADKINSSVKDEKEKESVLQKMLMSKMSNEQADNLKTVLNDKSALESLLSSDEAQKLMKKFGNK